MRLKIRLLAMLALTLALPSMSQNNPVIPPDTQLGTHRGAPEDEPRLRLEREMAKKANQERQANLKRDTEKLLKLATELKEFVDKSNEGTLSLDVLKKAEEIEKLARSVKGKMKGSY